MTDLQISEFIEHIVTTIAIFITGIWAFWRFILKRERHPKIQFDLDLRVIGKIDNKYLIEVISIIENKGMVRHDVKDLHFKLFYLPSDGKVDDGQSEFLEQVQFHKVKQKKYLWIPENEEWEGAFIDPGVVQRYTHITHLPDRAKFILVLGKFKYPQKDFFHTAQKTFSIK